MRALRQLAGIDCLGEGLAEYRCSGSFRLTAGRVALQRRDNDISSQALHVEFLCSVASFERATGLAQI